MSYKQKIHFLYYYSEPDIVKALSLNDVYQGPVRVPIYGCTFYSSNLASSQNINKITCLRCIDSTAFKNEERRRVLKLLNT